MKLASRDIQFEVETRMAPFGMFGGGTVTDSTETSEVKDENYDMATEEDIANLAKILGGGI